MGSSGITVRSVSCRSLRLLVSAGQHLGWNISKKHIQSLEHLLAENVLLLCVTFLQYQGLVRRWGLTAAFLPAAAGG